MRRIVMFNRVTVDGSFGAADGNIDWQVPQPEIDRGAVESLPGADTILFGRKTYELFESFWPHAVSDAPTVGDPHARGRASPEIRAMGVWINEVKKVVFSRTLKKVTWHNSRLVKDFDPREIEAMKSGPGKDMMVFGSGSIVSKLSDHGLIDEYMFLLTPLLLARGQPLFGKLTQNLKLKLLDATPYASGNVMLRYAPAK